MNTNVAPSYGELIGEWLTDQTWTHFTTITAPFPLSINSARRLAERTLSRWKSITNANANMAYAIERNGDGFSHHIHAVVKFKAEVTPDMFGDLVGITTKGRIDLQRYDKSLAGARYILKCVTTKADNWDIIN